MPITTSSGPTPVSRRSRPPAPRSARTARPGSAPRRALPPRLPEVLWATLLTALPVLATMTFDRTPKGFYTVMGSSVEQAAAGLEQAGADAVGSNCGNGVDNMVAIAREFSRHSSLPLVIQSNAGLPENRDGKVVYPESPDFMAQALRALAGIGVAVVGGCCGTTPEHIRAIAASVRGSGSES